MQDKEIEATKKQKGFTLVEVLITIFILVVIVIGLQYTLILNYKNVDMIKEEVYFGSAPDRNFNFIKNVITRNQSSEHTFSTEFVSVIGDDGLRIYIGDESGVKLYGYVMLANPTGTQQGLYYHVSTSKSKTYLSDADVESGHSMKLCDDIDDIRFTLDTSNGLLTIVQNFSNEPSGHLDDAPAPELLERENALKLYVY